MLPYDGRGENSFDAATRIDSGSRKTAETVHRPYFYPAARDGVVFLLFG